MYCRICHSYFLGKAEAKKDEKARLIDKLNCLTAVTVSPWVRCVSFLPLSGACCCEEEPYRSWVDTGLMISSKLWLLFIASFGKVDLKNKTDKARQGGLEQVPQSRSYEFWFPGDSWKDFGNSGHACVIVKLHAILFLFAKFWKGGAKRRW